MYILQQEILCLDGDFEHQTFRLASSLPRRNFFYPIDHFDPIGCQYSGGPRNGHECSYFSQRRHDPEPVRQIDMVFNLLNSTRHLLGLSNSIGKQISLQRQMKVGFEPRISGFSNGRSANFATSTAFSSNHCSSPKKSLMLGTAVAFHNIYIKQFFSIFGSFNYFFIFC